VADLPIVDRVNAGLGERFDHDVIKLGLTKRDAINDGGLQFFLGQANELRKSGRAYSTRKTDAQALQ
jgi:hypothetical protein